MTTTPVKVAVTGAAGKVAYDLLFRIAGGDMLGDNTQVELRLLDIPGTEAELDGRAMEIHDCAYSTLDHVETGTDPRHIFDRVDFALLVGGRPRGAGMDRAALLAANGAIFSEQGAVLNEVAASDIKVLVTGNPANTNCAITVAHAPDIPKDRFSALTRLDHDRARHRLGKKLGVNVDTIKKMSVWGNHSNTMYPDVFTAEVHGEPVWPRINDMAWLEQEFIPQVSSRGSAIISARGVSSTASAANATLAAARDWALGTRHEDWVSMAVVSDGSYGVPEGLICSFPVTITHDGIYHIVQGIEHNEFSAARIQTSVDELAQEWATVQALGLVPN